MFRAILTIGFIQVAVMAFNLLRAKVVAVTVGPEGVGIISVIDQIVVLVAQVTNLSLPFVAVKLLSHAHSESRQSFVNGYVALLRALLVVSVVGVFSGAALVLKWGDVLMPELVGYAGIVMLALLGIPATNLTAFLTNAMAAAQRLRPSVAMGLMTAIALAFASGTGILLAGLAGFYLGTVLGALAVVVGGLRYLRRREGLPLYDSRVTVMTEIRRYPQVVNLAGALYILAFTSPAAYLIARYAVLRMEGAVQAGLLQAAMGPALALATVLRSSNALFLTPAMNRLGEKGDKFRNATEFQWALAVISGVLALPAVLFPEWLLFLLYSSKFVGAGPYVYIFVLAEVLLLLAGVNQALVIGLDQIGAHMAVSVAGHAAIVVTSLWLVPKYGIGGVAIALLGNSLLVFILTAAWLWASHGMGIARSMGWLPVSILFVIGATGAGATYFSAETFTIIVAKFGLWVVFTTVGLFAVRRAAGRPLSEFARLPRR